MDSAILAKLIQLEYEYEFFEYFWWKQQNIWNWGVMGTVAWMDMRDWSISLITSLHDEPNMEINQAFFKQVMSQYAYPDMKR